VFGTPRVTPGYYIALGLLVFGLVTGAGLFVLLTANPGSATADIVVQVPQPDQCPQGYHATVCYRVDMMNHGHAGGSETCMISPAPGTKATFPEDATTTRVTLGIGEQSSIWITVVPDPSAQTAAEPSVDSPTLACAPG
jgi:hypothetical protein